MSKTDPNSIIRRAALTPGFERDILYAEHPFVTNSYFIATGPIQEAYEVVEQAVVHRESTCLVAQFRTGKTTAMRAICEQLMKTRPDLPFGTVIAKRHEKCSESMYFTDLTQDYGAEVKGASARNAVVIRNRFINTVVSDAARLESGVYLLMIDEAQNYGATELTFLRDAVNDCAKKHVAVVTIMFGHPELREIRKALVAANRMDLVARFLLAIRDFRGIADKEEFARILGAFDDTDLLEFPPKSGICYSEFFFPQAWSNGWRLVHEVDDAWSAIELTAQKFNRRPENIGMLWIGGAVRNFFFSQQRYDRLNFSGSSGVWRDAVSASGYAASLVR